MEPMTPQEVELANKVVKSFLKAYTIWRMAGKDGEFFVELLAQTITNILFLECNHPPRQHEELYHQVFTQLTDKITEQAEYIQEILPRN